jgi:hypothetical protein
VSQRQLQLTIANCTQCQEPAQPKGHCNMTTRNTEAMQWRHNLRHSEQPDWHQELAKRRQSHHSIQSECLFSYCSLVSISASTAAWKHSLASALTTCTHAIDEAHAWKVISSNSQRNFMSIGRGFTGTTVQCTTRWCLVLYA